MAGCHPRPGRPGREGAGGDGCVPGSGQNPAAHRDPPQRGHPLPGAGRRGADLEDDPNAGRDRDEAGRRGGRGLRGRPLPGPIDDPDEGGRAARPGREPHPRAVPERVRWGVSVPRDRGCGGLPGHRGHPGTGSAPPRGGDAGGGVSHGSPHGATHGWPPRRGPRGDVDRATATPACRRLPQGGQSREGRRETPGGGEPWRIRHSRVRRRPERPIGSKWTRR